MFTARQIIITLFVCFLPLLAIAQNNPAPWITYPSANITEYGVYHFRKAFEIKELPDSLIVHISADNRYNLFVNGERVCYGPAKGDLQTYKYDVIDIAPFLDRGKNQLAAIVNNAGKDLQMSMFSVQTAFFLRTPHADFQFINTDASWKVYKNPAYQPISYYEMLFKDRWFYGYYACGPGDEVVAEKYPWGWQHADFNDRNWKHAEALSFEEEPWNLVPRKIPYMDDHREKSAAIRWAKGVDVSDAFLRGKEPVTIPAHSQAKILIDHDFLTMGYPELTVTGGAGSKIQINYAEALYEKVNLKAHRDSVNNLTMYGVWDTFHPDGKDTRTFRPLWKRTFRYVQLAIETKDDPLTLVSWELEYSGYPYPHMSTFECDDERLNEIFEMGLRTLRMCSGETYYDTPYYEQLSYGGDNRPIAALSTYNSTDDRLLREALRLYPQSQNNETGLCKSAYPSRFNFDMGSWSLAWIQSLHDYYYMRGDSAFVKQFRSNIDKILRFYHCHMDESMGILGTIRCRNFMDWSITKGSLVRRDENREMTHTILLTLYYAHTLDCTARLYNEFGFTEQAAVYEKESAAIKRAVKNVAWDADRQLFKDYPDQDIFSQHTNIMAILCDVVPVKEQSALLERILADEFTEYASSYFSFYLFKAMQKTDRAELFLNHLDFWHTFIERGHTTCGETGFASHDRSDCHAWSAHPSYYLLSMVCGINPADTGFHSVHIAPHPGHLKNIDAMLPHPKGDLSVSYKRQKSKLSVNINLPGDMTGTFELDGKTVSLQPGKNSFTVAI